ncbi:methionine ABC transporter ATP-binding protein [Eubacterium aggregans]|uniref:methionine ABC transporter ATP-binding protein n=1 Tax=Eubacterium aggregans TaxID=81409 RepID=UPI003F410B75
MESIKEQPIVEIQGLGKTFHTKSGDIRALDDIKITINRGDIFGIIGMSGAGKSTLIRCMNLLGKPTEGRVLVDGQDIASLPEKELRRVRYSMGMIFQQFNLLEQRTAEKNILFALEIAGFDKDRAKDRAAELLELVGLSDRAQSYPSQLSGGQKQRVAIARALANEPKVLLCDEATSALDPSTTRSILNLLKDSNQKLGITIIIITHEMSVVEEICSHVPIIDKSQIAEQGSVESIFTNPRTAIAKKMIFPEGESLMTKVGQKCCRIVFDGSSSYDPVISKMILECKALVNIMFADMKNIDGTARGQMVIQLPEDSTSATKVLNYLHSNGLSVEEVADYVG